MFVLEVAGSKQSQHPGYLYNMEHNESLNLSQTNKPRKSDTYYLPSPVLSVTPPAEYPSLETSELLGYYSERLGFRI